MVLAPGLRSRPYLECIGQIGSSRVLMGWRLSTFAATLYYGLRLGVSFFASNIHPPLNVRQTF